MGLAEQGKAIRRSRERLNRTAEDLAKLDAAQRELERKHSLTRGDKASSADTSRVTPRAQKPAVD
jgi:hypothetical protein